jgi:hypothetical protein
MRNTTLRLSWLALGGTMALAAGCGTDAPSDATPNDWAALASDNGLRAINGLRANNGLAAGSGLGLGGGLVGPSGLSSSTGLMTTADGRLTAAYLVRCALPAGRSIVKHDQYGASYTFAGAVGLAPEWESGSCGQSCQMWVSACMLSMVNVTGVHYPIWLDAQNAAVGWGTDPKFTNQEGSFFGNLFQTPFAAYYCGGKSFGVGPIPGRIGSPQQATADVPYTDIYGSGVHCSKYCTPADYPHAGDGFKACSGWNQVITVWHE